MVRNGLLNRLQQQLQRRARSSPSCGPGSWRGSSRKPSARARGVIGVRIPATRTFQALRIQVNEELLEIRRGLPRLARRLRAGGRLAVISFHSLEDRIVKQFFARAALPYEGDARLAKVPLRADALPVPPLMLVGRAIMPGEAEVAANPRARSAVLRVAQRSAAAWPEGLVA